jgi:hypothetical protein
VHYDTFEVVPHLARRDSDGLNSVLSRPVVTVQIRLCGSLKIMRQPINFNCYRCGQTEKVEHIWAERMLLSES